MSIADFMSGATALAPATRADCRQIGLIRRKPGLSPVAFSQHWREVHGPLGLKALTNARAYVQNHALFDAPLPAGLLPARYDGMAEVWFDTPVEAASVGDNEAYKRTVKPDERNFLDTYADDLIGRGQVFQTERVGQERPAAKLVVLLRRRQDVAPGRFMIAVLGMEAPAGALRTDHIVADPEVYRDRRPAFDAIVGLWADDAAAAAALWSDACRRALEALTTDERQAFLANPVRMLWP